MTRHSGKFYFVASLALGLLSACGDAVGGTDNSTESACTLDSIFQSNLGSGFNGSVDEIRVQDDGRILAAGRYTTFQGSTRNGLVRLEKTGLPDNAFNNLAVPNDSVFAVAVASDGSIFIGGTFASVTGQSGAKMAKLGADGRVDSTFSTNVGTAPDGDVSTLVIDGSQRILIGGNFSSASSQTLNHFARYSATGQLDATLASALGAGFNLGVDTISVLAGDSYLLGGSFSTFQGQPPGRITRFSDAGVLQTGFVQELGRGFDNAVKSIVERATGGFLVGGSFSTLNGVSRKFLAGIGADGIPDDGMQPLFPTAINATVQVVARQANGKLLVGGDFIKGLYRIGEDGQEDIAFTANCGTGFDGSVFSVVGLGDGTLLVGGDFTHFNGVSANGLAHLQ